MVSIYMSWLKMNKNVDDMNIKIGFIEPFGYITSKNRREHVRELYNTLGNCEKNRAMLMAYNGGNNNWILVAIDPYKDQVDKFNPLKNGDIYPELKDIIRRAFQDFKLEQTDIQMN